MSAVVHAITSQGKPACNTRLDMYALVTYEGHSSDVTCKRCSAAGWAA